MFSRELEHPQIPNVWNDEVGLDIHGLIPGLGCLRSHRIQIQGFLPSLFSWNCTEIPGNPTNSMEFLPNQPRGGEIKAAKAPNPQKIGIKAKIPAFLPIWSGNIKATKAPNPQKIGIKGKIPEFRAGIQSHLSPRG